MYSANGQRRKKASFL